MDFSGKPVWKAVICYHDLSSKAVSFLMQLCVINADTTRKLACLRKISRLRREHVTKKDGEASHYFYSTRALNSNTVSDDEAPELIIFATICSCCNC